MLCCCCTPIRDCLPAYDAFIRPEPMSKSQVPCPSSGACTVLPCEVLPSGIRSPVRCCTPLWVIIAYPIQPCSPPCSCFVDVVSQLHIVLTTSKLCFVSTGCCRLLLPPILTCPVTYCLSCRQDVNEIIVGTMQNSILRFPIGDTGNGDADASTTLSTEATQLLS